MGRIAQLLLVLMVTLQVAACEFVGEIFKVGMLAGVIGVLAVVFILWMIIRKIRGL